MRKITLVLLVLLASQATAHAGNQLSLGIGVVSSSFSTTPASANMSGATGLTLGAALELDAGLGELLTIEPGIAYVPRGFSVGTFDQTVHYLDVPILLKATLPVVGPLIPFVAAGPGVGYELTTYASVLVGMVIVKKLDFTANVAAGFESSILPFVKTYVRAGYSLGLTNVLDAPTAGSEAKTRALLVTTGLVLPF
jgi:hypothetical protein